MVKDSEWLKHCFVRFLINSEIHKNVLAIKDSLLNFTHRLVNLFQRPSSYYNLVEVGFHIDFENMLWSSRISASDNSRP